MVAGEALATGLGALVGAGDADGATERGRRGRRQRRHDDRSLREQAADRGHGERRHEQQAQRGHERHPVAARP